jgi:hypothetical protein
MISAGSMTALDDNGDTLVYTWSTTGTLSNANLSSTSTLLTNYTCPGAGSSSGNMALAIDDGHGCVTNYSWAIACNP